jgi:ribonuclease HI
VPHVQIFADGACSGNPGPGGWGAVLISAGRERELAGGAPTTTNNRMELTAAIEALKALTRPSTVDFYTDSVYLRSGITGWIDGWKRNGWRTSDRKPVKNVDLWQALDAARAPHDITWHWVKGHADNPGNNRADALARQGMAPFKPRPAKATGEREG